MTIDPQAYITQILNECTYIKSVITHDLKEDDFQKNETLKRSIIGSLEIIVETAKKIPEELSMQWSEIAWKSIASFRDRFIYDDINVNYSNVWKLASNDIPYLFDNITDLKEKKSKNTILNEAQIQDIAGELECGMKCFYNLKTGDIKKVIDFENPMFEDDGLWEDDIRELEENGQDYFEFEKLDSRQSFQIMEDFAEKVEDLNLKVKLVDALNRRKPFSNFKWVIDNSDYREKWFEYKSLRYLNAVKKQVYRLNNILNNANNKK